MTKPMWITAVVVALALLIAVLANRQGDEDIAVTTESPAMSVSPVPGAQASSARTSSTAAAGSPGAAATAFPDAGSSATAPESISSAPIVDRFGVTGSVSSSAGYLPPSVRASGNPAASTPGDGESAVPPEGLDAVSSVSVGLPPEAGSAQVPGIAPESSDVAGAQMLPPEGNATGVVGPGPGEADAGVPTQPPES